MPPGAKAFTAGPVDVPSTASAAVVRTSAAVRSHSLFEGSEFLIPTWVTPHYRDTSKNIYTCACVRLILVLVGGRQTAIVARYDSMIPGTGTYYVPDTYVPGISRQKSTRTYVMFLFLFPLFV